LLRGPSFALYLAPYAEGSLYSSELSQAVGVGLGMRLAFGRFAGELMTSDVTTRTLGYRPAMGLVMVGISYRLGQ